MQAERFSGLESNGLSQGGEEVEAVRQDVGEHLRWVHNKRWRGAFRHQGSEFFLRLDEGWGAFAFAGGEGRRLEVQAPAARVEVVGTRFWVSVGAQGQTEVAVAEGMVRVWPSRGASSLELRSGQMLSIDVQGDLERMAHGSGQALSWRMLNDSYLLGASRHEPQPVKKVLATRGRGTERKLKHRALQPGGRRRAERAETGRDALAALERAEQLLLSGDVGAAEKAYQGLAGRYPKGRLQRYGALARLALARLWAFERQRTAEARELLESLARSDGAEIGRQARITLCEIDLEEEPCAARLCLQTLRDGPRTDFELAREVDRLLKRWALEDLSCGRGGE